MDLHNVTKTFKVIFTEPVRYTANETYDSIKILSGQTKPSYEEFKEVYDNVVHIIIPFENLRVKRNELLKYTDWTQTNDIGLENEVEWEVYRQALRDLPSTTEDPETPIWPEQPQVKIVKGKNIRTELSDTKTELKEDLQTTRTELAEAKTDLQATRANVETINSKFRDENTLEATNAKLDHLTSQTTLLQNVVFSLTKRIQQLEQA
jgi:chromosome segregation ATPase